jgi:hypothetical protein
LYFESADAATNLGTFVIDDNYGQLRFGSLNDGALTSRQAHFIVLDSATGFMAIGHNDPKVRLDVQGDAIISGDLGLGLTATEKLHVDGNAIITGTLTVNGEAVSMISPFFGGYGWYENLAAHSEMMAFDDAQWQLLSGSSYTDGYTAPNGVDSSHEITFVTSGDPNLRGHGCKIVNSTQYTLSFWSKLISGNGDFQVDLNDGGHTNITAISSWVKHEVNLTSGTGGDTDNFIDVSNMTSNGVMQFWGWQINTGYDNALPYVETVKHAMELQHGSWTNGYSGGQGLFSDNVITGGAFISSVNTETHATYDAYDVAGKSIIKIDTNGGNATMRGFTNGIEGQRITIIKPEFGNNLVFDHLHANGDQKIITHTGAGFTMTDHGACELVYDGTYWYILK